MTLVIENPVVEAKIAAFAKQQGVDPSTLIARIVGEYSPTTQGNVVPEDDPLIARLRAQLAEAPTDPGVLRDAEDDLRDFMRNMNANRAATGERIPYPDVK